MNTICYWPNGDWCEKDTLESYVAELGLSDDYQTISVAEDFDSELIDFYVEKLTTEDGYLRSIKEPKN
jgi:hypothetical protein